MPYRLDSKLLAVSDGQVLHRKIARTGRFFAQQSFKSKNVRADKFADYTDHLNKKYGCINATLESDGDDGYDLDLETSLDD